MNLKVELSNGTTLKLTEVDGELVIYDCVNKYGDQVTARAFFRENGIRIRFGYD